MEVPTAAKQQYNSQRAIAARTLRSVKSLWRRVGVDFDAGWSAISADLTARVNSGMLEAAEAGIEYIPEVLEQTGQNAAMTAAVSASAFTGWTREGVAVEDALHGAIRAAKQAVTAGHSAAGALMLGGKSLNRVVPSVIADAGRGASHVALTTTGISGYVRLLSGASCRDCIVLAGKWYRWNEGFQRHPHCDCRHIPSAENAAGDFQTDPYEAFHAMPEEDQERVFGKTDARAIRDGADIYRVVNTSRRGLPTVKAYRPPRMTIDDIYRQAGTRTNAVRMLTEQGYILPGGQQAGGVIAMDAQTAHLLGGGALGRGGTRKGATLAHQQAARTGIRDQTNRATQTAAERRLNDAVLSAQAVGEGRNPYGTYRLNDAARKRAASDLDDEIRRLRAGAHPRQVYKLADLLGVNYR